MSYYLSWKHVIFRNGKKSDEALQESEEKYRSLIENAGESIVIAQGANLKFVNKRAVEFLGYPKEELLSRPFLEFVHPGDCVSVATEYQRSFRGERLKPLTFRIIRGNGEVRIVEIQPTPILWYGAPAILDFIKDITRQKQAEIALRESEERYRNVVEDQTEFICRFLPDGTHVFVNDAYCRYFGLKRDEIIGHKFRPTIPDVDRERVRRFFESLTPGHLVDTIEHRIIMPDGSIQWQWWSDRAIFDNDRNIREFQSVGRDITGQKTIENTLRISQLLLTEAMDLAHMANWELHDRTGMFTFNDRFYALYGTTAEREGGYQMPMDIYFREFVHPDDRDRITVAVKGGREMSGPQNVSELEHRIIRRDGEIRHILVRIKRTMDEQSGVITIHGVNQDITRRKRAED